MALPQLPEELIDFILNDVKEVITLNLEDIPFDNDFQPMVTPDLAIKDWVNDYLVGLKHYLDLFIETKDIRYYDLVCNLMPTAMFIKYKSILDESRAKKEEAPADI